MPSGAARLQAHGAPASQLFRSWRWVLLVVSASRNCMPTAMAELADSCASGQLAAFEQSQGTGHGTAETAVDEVDPSILSVLQLTSDVSERVHKPSVDTNRSAAQHNLVHGHVNGGSHAAGSPAAHSLANGTIHSLAHPRDCPKRISLLGLVMNKLKRSRQAHRDIGSSPHAGFGDLLDLLAPRSEISAPMFAFVIVGLLCPIVFCLCVRMVEVYEPPVKATFPEDRRGRERVPMLRPRLDFNVGGGWNACCCLITVFLVFFFLMAVVPFFTDELGQEQPW